MNSPKRSREARLHEASSSSQYSMREKLMSYFMRSLDDIVKEPFVYFAKRPDPVALHRAIQYISDNELSDNIYIVHFIDDRRYCGNIWEQCKSIEEEGVTVASSLLCEKYTKVVLSSLKDISADVQTSRRQDYAMTNEAQKLVDCVSILDTYYA